MRVGIRLTTALNNWRRESSRSEDAEDKLGPLKSSGLLNFIYKLGCGCCL